ncbi:peptidoglycan-binding protein [Micromonospora sp. NPDC049645]|uniref:peptidoglycan-binding domain-containing protein n=1 Tax=Micromonospora sp. NPDC049645 TaxID=3155508 RepID=UPI003438F781
MACTCSTPPALALERDRLRALGGTFLGCCGDQNHKTGFHMAGCATRAGDYSLRYGKGNPSWAAGIDVGMDFAHSRDWLVYTVAQATAGRRPGLCEIIGQPAGKPVLYWAEWHNWVPRIYTGSGHKTHSHLGCKRDVIARPGTDLHLLDWRAGTKPPAAPAPPKPAAPAEIAAVRNLPTLRKGSKGNYVRNAQGLLVARGRSIKIDGDFGSATAAAVKAEQREYGITADSVIGLHTWSTFTLARKATTPGDLPTLRKGSKGTPVRTLQGLLVANGRAIKIDGDFGPATDGALYAEQREYGIAADRIAGGHSWATLIARRKS